MALTKIPSTLLDTTSGLSLSGDITLADSVKAQFGASNDLQIYHDGSNSYVKDAGTGDLYIQGTQLRLQSATGESFFVGVANGAAYVYHNGSAKLNTTATGIDVTGNITVSGTVDGRDVATDGTKLDTIETNADVTDTTNVTAAGALMDSEITNLAQVKAFDSSDYATAAQGTTADSALQNIVEDTTPQLGGDLASNGNDILFADNDKAIFGTGSDLQIYHNGNNSFITDTGTGNLYLRAANNLFVQGATDNDALATFQEDGFVKLYFNNAEKLATTSTGIDVTGTANADKVLVSKDGTDHIEVVDTSSGQVTNLTTGNTVGYISVDPSNSVANSKFGVYVDGSEYLEVSSTGIDVTGNIVVSGTVDGRDVATDGTKLDGIEANATADQTQSEINALGITATGLSGTPNITVGTISSGAITSTGAIQGASFSDGTISGITFIDEDSFATNSATRIPTQQSIKAYVDTQVAGVVDSAPAALDTLNELAAALGDDANFSTTTSTALGNRLRVDTAAQGLTGTQQANAITNLGITATKAELNFVDGVTSNIQTQLNTKLASSSYTAADVLTKIKTVDGAGSGLDADLLDGISSASFLRSDADDTHSGTLTVTTALNIVDSNTSLQEGGADTLRIQTGTGYIDIGSKNSTYVHFATDRSKFYFDSAVHFDGQIYNYVGGGTSDPYWRAGNDGAGSGLDADLLDGQQGSYYAPASTALTTSTSFGGDVSGTYNAIVVADDSHNHVISNVDGLQTALDAKLASSSYTAADVLTKIKTVDGAGSGLDADLLDGISSASFLRSDAADSWNIGRGDVYIEDNSADNPSGAGITLRTSSNPSSGDPASVGNIFAIRSSGQALRFAVGQSITSTGDNDFTTNGLTANGNITVTGTVDGRDIASDGSKLDGIESGATADQTAAEILTAIKTVDGAGSGLDADLLDGQSSAYYATASSVTALAALDPIITLTGAVTGTGTMTNLGNVTIATTATADPTLTLSGDASGSATFTNLGNATLSVTVADNSHNHSSSSGDFTVNGGNLYTGTSQQRVKLSVWSGATYGIGMGAGYTFGGIANEYVLSNQMSNTNGRGFWWGDSSHTNAQGAMALTTQGYLTVANRIRVGYGESDTTTPAATLDVNGTIKLDGNYPTGSENVALGNTALDSLSTGARNVAIGTNAGTAISSGTDNTAVGMNALASVTTGLTNTAVGRNSLYSNTGSNNTGLGYYALFANTTGGYNTSVGRNALDANTTASFNTAVGYNSLGVNTTGTKNVAFGASAGESCTTGSYNVFVGESAGFDATDATNNVFIGFETQNDNAGTGSQVVIGHKARSQGGGKFTVGTSNSTYSYINIGSSGGFTGSSDERLKKEITDSTAGLSFINDLRPVTFKWKTKGEVDTTFPHYEEGSTKPAIGESDSNALTKHGFIAQEVKAAIDNHTEVKDGSEIWEESRDGTQNFCPTALIPMLVKSIHELSAKCDSLQSEINILKGE